MYQLNIGLNDESRTKISEKLSEILASNYTLSLKTQNFHWNVKGHFFQPLHLLFEEQYNTLSIADESTNDLLTPLLSNHEKTAWMLRSFLGL